MVNYIISDRQDEQVTRVIILQGMFFEISLTPFCLKVYNYINKDLYILINTVDSVEGMLWLATQTLNIIFYSPPSNMHEVCTQKYCNCCRNKWVKILFLHYITSLFIIYTKTTFLTQCLWLVVDIYLEVSTLWLGKYPPPATSNLVNVNVP